MNELNPHPTGASCPPAIMRWHDISRDPNSRAAREWRHDTVRGSSQSQTVERIGRLRELCAGKKVLDIGCVAHYSDSAQQSEWLHRHLAESAAECLGVDILEDDVLELQRRGFRVIAQDVLATPIADTFDVIVCGEMIEHISRPGDLFSSAAKMLSPDGRLLITTPNPWYVGYILKAMFPQRFLPVSVDHVAWYDAPTLAELAERNGFALTGHQGLVNTHHVTMRARLAFWLTRILQLAGCSPSLSCRSCLYEFRLA